MDFLPIFLSIKEKSCVVIGGGDVATRKIASLLRAGGKVTVIAPQLSASNQKLADNGKIEHHAREYKDADLDNATLVIAATDDESTNAEIAKHAQEQG
ncbi:bifunctional precorrin-2 dehydrogenase/sirohydrochlorin ferrochelatase, partial [Solemya velum gill symbiont]